MADIITGTTTGYVNNTQDAILQGVSDIRREGAEHNFETVKEVIKSTDNINSDVKDGVLNSVMATKDARFDVISKVNESTASLVSQIDKQYHAAEARAYDQGKALAELTGIANLNRQATIDAVVAASERGAQAAQIAVLQNTIEGQKNTQYLADKITAEGKETRALMESLKNADLNRMLIERNAEIVEERGDARRWRGAHDQGQFQVLASQLQAFQSQLSHQIASQGTVNFGTMSGNAGRNTSTNNVV